MAEEIVVWCDEHLRRYEHQAGTPVLLTLDRKEYRVDLCQECEARLLGPVRDVLASAGQVLSKSAPKAVTTAGTAPSPDRRFPCPMCVGVRPMGKAQDLGRHLERQHGAVSPRMGDLCSGVCPRCGQNSGSFFASAKHCSRQHEYSYMELLIEARDHGDPHGAWAAFLKNTDGDLSRL